MQEIKKREKRCKDQKELEEQPRGTLNFINFQANSLK